MSRTWILATGITHWPNGYVTIGVEHTYGVFTVEDAYLNVSNGNWVEVRSYTSTILTIPADPESSVYLIRASRHKAFKHAPMLPRATSKGQGETYPTM